MYDFGVSQPHTGYRIAYRPQETNHCPGCGQTHWMIGRTTAECANCATALPLVAGSSFGTGVMRQRGLQDFQPLAA